MNVHFCVFEVKNKGLRSRLYNVNFYYRKYICDLFSFGFPNDPLHKSQDFANSVIEKTLEINATNLGIYMVTVFTFKLQTVP